MSINPNPIKTLTDKHAGLIEDLYTLQEAIDQLKKKMSPHLIKGFTRKSVSSLKNLERCMRCEEEALFPILKLALGNEREPIISMLGDHENLKEEMERLRTVI